MVCVIAKQFRTSSASTVDICFLGMNENSSVIAELKKAIEINIDGTSSIRKGLMVCLVHKPGYLILSMQITIKILIESILS